LEKVLLRVLWLNWRDIKNPEAGGSEVLTHEVARRLIKDHNCDITLFTSKFAKALPLEHIDGIRIIRQGGKYTVYQKAKRHIKSKLNEYDLIIDEINARGFLTPKFVKDKPVVALIHQLSTEQFFHEIPFPLNFVGRYYLEKKWLSYYKQIPTVTVSNSTKNELEALGFTNVYLIPEGLSVSPLSAVPQKETRATIVFIGRLKKHKLPDHAIRAFSIINNKIPEAKLWVIGEGYLRKKLQDMDVKNITFYGHVNDSKKLELLSRAHVVLMPAMREGWGLVVTESNSMGTPVVAYNVPGLRDSVKDGITGILSEENTPSGLASAALLLLEDEVLLYELSNNALIFSRNFSWDISANIFSDILVKVSQEKYPNV
jgi:glycosyltransferase involved in cell wall biosynthesis